jgi:hypothetical protein
VHDLTQSRFNYNGGEVNCWQGQQDDEIATPDEVKDFLTSAIKEAYYAGRLSILEKFEKNQKIKKNFAYVYKEPKDKPNFLNS